MLWLIQHEVALDMQRAREARLHLSLTDEQRGDFAKAATSAIAGVPRNYQVAGDVAEIRVEGVLTPKPDLFAFYFGGGNTTWESIRQALALAQADTGVKRVQWLISSPGGQVDGMFDTLAAMEAFSKPMSVRASMACSAAYVIACLGGKIEATSAAGYFGSVGVVRSYYVDEHIVEVTNREAPNKRPDPTTPEGKSVIQDELDAIADLTHEAISKGRGTTVRDVVQNFGRGGTVLAGDARRRGMIDRIAKPFLRALPIEGSGPTAADEQSENQPVAAVGDLVGARAENPSPAPKPGAQPQRKTIMNKKELQENHPEVYAAILAEGRALGETAGASSERDRCVAHLTMGEASGDMKTAVAAVQSGEGMTATVNAKYMAASMNRRDTNTRQAESDGAVAAVAGATPPPATGAPAIASTEAAPDLGDQVVALIDSQRGKAKPKAQASA